MTVSRVSVNTTGPVNFKYGIVGYTWLSGMVPLNFSMAAIPWSPYELNTFVYGLWVSILFGIIISLPLAIGIRRRPVWWIKCFSKVSITLIALYGLGMLLSVAYLVGFIPLRPGNDPALGIIVWVGFLISVIIGIPAALMLLNTLKDPYWWSNRSPDYHSHYKDGYDK